jgi:hypothetical protein
VNDVDRLFHGPNVRFPQCSVELPDVGISRTREGLSSRQKGCGRPWGEDRRIRHHERTSGRPPLASEAAARPVDERYVLSPESAPAGADARADRASTIPGGSAATILETFGVIAEAKRHLGANGSIVGMARQWCGAFVRLVMRNTGHRDLPSGNLAIAWARYGAASSPHAGVIGVLRHHVVIVKAVEGNRVLAVSGNHGRRVAEGYYPLSRFVAFRAPI